MSPVSMMQGRFIAKEKGAVAVSGSPNLSGFSKNTKARRAIAWPSL